MQWSHMADMKELCYLDSHQVLASHQTLCFAALPLQAPCNTTRSLLRCDDGGHADTGAP